MADGDQEEEHFWSYSKDYLLSQSRDVRGLPSREVPDTDIGKRASNLESGSAMKTIT